MNSMGYDTALPDYAVLPDGLLDHFKGELMMDDGTNLIEGLEVIGQQAEPLVEEIKKKPIDKLTKNLLIPLYFWPFPYQFFQK